MHAELSNDNRKEPPACMSLIDNLNLDGEIATVCRGLHRLDRFLDRQDVCDELSDISKYSLVRETDHFWP